MKKFYLLLSFMLVVCYNAQTYYSQDFNAPGLSGWVNTDLNNDGYVWSRLNASSIDAAYGAGSLVSFSYIDAINAAVTPNNLITSPLIDLSAAAGASNVKLIYNMGTHPTWPQEKYSVYVTTTNVASAIIATAPVFTEIVAVGGIQTRTIDLTSFAGQQVYISFRHYECNDKYYLIIDNVNVKSLLNNDVALTKVDLARYGLMSTDYTLKATIKNNGNNTVSGVTVNWNDGTDHIATIPVNNLAYGASATVTHTIPVNYATLVEKNLAVTLTQVNGGADSTPADNMLSAKFNTVSQNSPKKVLIEEGTGTWCGWCPRGMVAMAYMDANYAADFVGIAVHNGSSDPMLVPEYDSGSGISGFPGMNVDRVIKGEGVTQALMASHVQTRKALIVPAALNASATFSGSNITVDASATFRSNFSNANFRLGAILVEDGVTGTTSGYNQVNYYANNAAGAMGGYESLPNPVPAAQMVYDHVGRMLLGGYAGQAGSVPAVITDGQVVSYTFTGTMPANTNTNNIKIVLVLIDNSTGEVVNARSFLVSALGTSDLETNKNYLTVYPNPSTGYFKVQANYNFDVKLYDASGKLVLEKKNVAPDQPVSTNGLSKGIYFVSLKDKKGDTKNQKLIVK